MKEAFEKIKERLKKEVIALEDNYGDLVECIPSKVVFEIVNQVAEEYRSTMGRVKCDASFSAGYKKAIDNAIEKFLEYGCFCIEWNPKLPKEKLVEDVLRQVKGQSVYILEKLKQKEIEIVNQVAEEFGNSEQVNKGWIPCSERLPDVPEEIEDSECPEFNVTIKGAVQSTTLKYAPDGTWFDDDGEIYRVIAWQPLPEPYKPREE